MNKGLTIVSLLPVALLTMFILAITLLTGMDSFTWYIIIPLWISLLVSGIGFSSDNKKWNIAGCVSTLMLTIASFFVGYDDYFQWTTTIICLGLLTFFMVIFMIKCVRDKKVKLGYK